MIPVDPILEKFSLSGKTNNIADGTIIYFVDILDNQRCTIMNFVNLSNENSLDISALISGNYICKIFTKTGVSDKTFIKI